MDRYDYILIGGGPTSLTLAWILGSNNKKVLIIEKEGHLGGCHGVERVDGYFTEHGPRVYSDSYLYFMELLKDMGMKFEDLFVPYKFQISKINDYSPASFKISEYGSFAKAFIRLIIDVNYGKTISMEQFMVTNNFSEETTIYIDRLCRLTDGATYDRYTLNQFLQLINQQLLYNMYQPNEPNDIGLIKKWYDKIKQIGNIYVTFEEEVILLNKFININRIESVKTNKGLYYGDSIIITVPPKPLYELMEKSAMLDLFRFTPSEFKQWTLRNSYFDYICITYHYNKRINLPKLWGFKQGPWDIVFIILSNYMNLNTDPSKTLISIAITNIESKNEDGKTANDCSEKELLDEVAKQLSYFPKPDKVILAPNIKKKDGKWSNEDTAFVITTENQYLDYKTKIDNMYSVGIHNGNSTYKFTSLESAVQNAVYFVKNELKNIKCNIMDKHITNVRDLFMIVLYVIILLAIYKFINNLSSN